MLNAKEKMGRSRASRLVTGAAFALLALCLPGAASAQWTTNGTNTTTTDNVGVGTATPSQMFHVHSSTGTWAGTRVTTAATGSTFQDGVNFGYDDPIGAYIWNREASPIVFSTSNTEKARLDASGNFGIGTAAPAAKLDVNGSATFSGATTVAGRGTFSIDDSNRLNLSMFNPFIVNAPTLMVRGGVESVDNYLGMRFSPTNSLTVYVPSSGNAYFNQGNVGIGTSTPVSKLHVAGDVRVDGNISAKYQDVAEWVPTTQKLGAGTVVVLDRQKSNQVLASVSAYDTTVAGVISEKPGLALGEAGEGKVLVATTGRVKVKVDATHAPVRVGDLLVTSATPGVAMRSQPLDLGGVPIHRPGTIIGKALEPLAGGTGEILVLLSLQ
jgi:hypothetical protein